MTKPKIIADETSDMKIRVSAETRQQLEAIARRDAVSISLVARQVLLAGLKSPTFQKESSNL